MRIVLLYPPPWKVPEQGEDFSADSGGPPGEYTPGDLDGDFFQAPYGLLSLGAEAMRAGHDVKVFNLSGLTWRRVLEVIERLDAPLFGMSCWTANRRGVALVATEIKRLHPTAHVVIGGPHATPLYREMLEHYPQIDTVALGESEETLLDLAERLERGESTVGVPGTAYRFDGSVVKGPARPAIKDLDRLESPHAHFATHLMMTSRGCPWRCTFCGADTTWGRGYRGQSIEYVLDSLEKQLERLPVRIVQIKDDTFTTNKKRVLDLCRGMRARGLRFLWSCDTRVDVINEDLLKEMRLAGCERLSLGVESGSQRILDGIDKKITPEEIIDATRMAKKFGINVRYFMMLGNRGETRETFEETLDFLHRAAPHSYIFSCLSIYPGTQDFMDAEAAGWFERETYFSGDFQEFKVPFDASEEDTELFSTWFEANKGVRTIYRPSVADCQAVLEELGEHHAAVVDLGAAYYREGNATQAAECFYRALALDYPLPGLVHNYLACIAADKRDLSAVQTHFQQALSDPQHLVVKDNLLTFRRWLADGGPVKGLPLTLRADHDFRLFERTEQPALPGQIPEDFAVWAAPVQRRSNPVQKLRVV